jgi:hypothetical protein
MGTGHIWCMMTNNNNQWESKGRIFSLDLNGPLYLFFFSSGARVGVGVYIRDGAAGLG